MIALLDTHILLWALYKSSMLSDRALAFLKDPAMTFVYSVATLWEVQIKHQKNRETMPPSAQDLHGDCQSAGLTYMTVRPNHIFGLGTLNQLPGSREHRDPFDRLLLAQAKVEGCAFLTHFSLLASYGEPFVELV